MRLPNILQGFTLSRRIFFIFVCCVLMPLSLFLGLFSFSLEDELKEQAFQRMRFQAKTLSIAIMDKLLQVRGELQFFISSAWDASRRTFSSFPALPDSNALGHFEELIHQGPHGAVSLLQAGAGVAPFSPAELGALGTGKPTLIQRKAGGRYPQLWMALSLSDADVLIGRINSGFLWNEDSEYNLPPNNEICVIGDSDAVLVSSLAGYGNLVRAVAGQDRTGNLNAFTWKNDQDVYLSSVYSLFLKSAFGTGSWRLTLSMPQDTILAPIRSFQMYLILTGLLVALAAFLVSSMAIRRSLKPLDRLVASAGAMGAGDFSVKADVEGTIELQGLSEAFNAMARKIEKQFTDIRKSEEQFRIAFDDSAVGMALVGLDGQILRANPFLADMLGYSQGDLHAKSLQDIVYAETVDGLAVECRSILDSTPADHAVEKRFHRRDGEVIFGLVNSSLLYDGAGQPLYFILHVQDITKQKEMAGIEAARERAEIASRAKSEFLANMSHELRTPLNHIIGFSELISAGIAGEVNPQQREYLGDVVHSSHHLLSLVNDILDLAKVEAGKQTLEPADVDVRAYLKSSLVMIKEKAMKHGIELSLNVNGVPETIRADERKFKQILYNLLSNAIKFTPEGGRIELTAKACNGDTEDLAALGVAPSPYVQISVSDSGVGLNPEDLERVFQPFEQVSKPGQPKVQGTGLGLSLTQQLVELHGGRIWATSAGMQKGATFSFVMPG